jgi:6-phosphogluconolactonase
MKAPAKSCKVFLSAAVLILLISALAGQAFADTKPKFVYVANEDFSNVSGYTLDSTSGALSTIAGSPFPTPGWMLTSVAVDPSGKFAYVVAKCVSNDSCLNGLVSAYSIDGTTGALTLVAGSPFAAGASAHSVAVDPSGLFVYVANECLALNPNCTGNGTVSAYTINRATGALTPVSGSPFPAGAYAFSVTTDPSGKFAYVVNVCTLVAPGCTPPGTVSAYTIDRTMCALTPVLGSPFMAGGSPESVAVNPAGTFAYVVNDTGTISAYSIDSHTGALTPIAGSPFVATGLTPVSVAVDPAGKFAYVANYCGINSCDRGGVGVYAINSTTGALTVVPGAFVAAGTTPNTAVVDPSGKFVYVSNECADDFCSSGIGSVSAYSIDSVSGLLTPIVGAPFAAGVRPKSLAVVSQSGNVPFECFKVKAEIDEDRKTSFHVEGFFALSKGSNGIDPDSESVELQVGSYLVSIPAGSFNQKGRRDRDRKKNEFKFDGEINNVDLRIQIIRVKGDDYLFTSEGRGHILQGIKNPVTVGLTIGDDEGSTTVKADIDR